MVPFRGRRLVGARDRAGDHHLLSLDAADEESAGLVGISPRSVSQQRIAHGAADHHLADQPRLDRLFLELPRELCGHLAGCYRKKKTPAAYTRAGAIALSRNRTLSTSFVHHRAMALRPGPSAEGTGAHTTRAAGRVAIHETNSVRRFSYTRGFGR